MSRENPSVSVPAVVDREPNIERKLLQERQALNAQATNPGSRWLMVAALSLTAGGCSNVYDLYTPGPVTAAVRETFSGYIERADTLGKEYHSERVLVNEVTFVPEHWKSQRALERVPDQYRVSFTVVANDATFGSNQIQAHLYLPVDRARPVTGQTIGVTYRVGTTRTVYVHEWNLQ